VPVGQPIPTRNGGNTEVLALGSGGDVTKYTGPIVMSRAGLWSVQIIWTSTSALIAAATLYRTNIANPNFDNDTDWVNDTTVAFDGVSGGGSDKEFCEIGNSGAFIYRIKFARSGGTGSVVAHWCIKNFY
jgi:hypothetical protein